MTFNPDGPLSQTITITILGDTDVEPAETFAVNLSNVSGAVIADGAGVVSILPGVAASGPVQWKTEDGGNGNYYELIDAGIDWATAAAHAVTRSHLGLPGRLVSVTSALENLFLSNTFGADRLHLHWLGGLQTPGGAEPNGGFRWIVPEEFDYDNWADGEPNENGDGRNEDRIAFDHFTSAAGKHWNDLAGGNLALGYIVEYDRPPVVRSITRSDPRGPATNRNSVTFLVTFSEPVKGFDAADLRLNLSGDVSAEGVEITPALLGPVSSTYSVTVRGVTGSGTLGLSLIDDDTISDAAGNVLGGPGPINGDFQGEQYVISPAVIQIAATVTHRGVVVPEGSTVRVGEVLQYEYRVTNSSLVPLSGYRFSDMSNAAPTLEGGDDDGDGLLDQGETWIYRSSRTVTRDTFINVAAMTREDSFQRSVLGTVSTSCFGADPRIELSKFLNGVATDPTGSGIPVDTPISFIYTVRNTGNMPISRGSLSLLDDNGTPNNLADDFAPGSDGDPNGNGLLDIGEEWTFRVTTLAGIGTQNGQATATAEAEIDFGLKIVTDSAFTTYQGLAKPDTQEPTEPEPKDENPVTVDPPPFPFFAQVEQKPLLLNMGFGDQTGGPVAPPSPAPSQINNITKPDRIRPAATDQTEGVLLAALSEVDVAGGDMISGDDDLKELPPAPERPQPYVVQRLEDLPAKEEDIGTLDSIKTAEWPWLVALASSMLFVASLAVFYATRTDSGNSNRWRAFNVSNWFQRLRRTSLVDRLFGRSSR